MSAGNTTENDLLKLIFHAIAIANLADNAAAAPLTNLYVAWHTADPGEGGDQTTSEAGYTGYARVAVPRSAVGWTITNNIVNPAYNIEAPVCTAVPGANLTHFSVGYAAAGASKVIVRGTLTPNVIMGVGVIPRVTTATAISLD